MIKNPGDYMAIPAVPYEFFSIRLSKNRFSKHCKATGSSSTTRGLALATRNQFLLLTSLGSPPQTSCSMTFLQEHFL